METAKLTLNELTKILRDHGIPASEGIVAQQIEEGVFSDFATCTRPNGPDGRRYLTILRKPLMAWLEKNT